MRQEIESAAGIGDYQPRAARSSAISGLTRPVCLTNSSAFGPRTSLGKADGPRTRTNRAAFDCQHTESRSFLKEKEIVFFCLRAWPPTCRFSPSETALPGRGSAALRRAAARAAPRGGATWAAQPIRREAAAYGTHILRCRHGKTHVWYQNSRRTPPLTFLSGANNPLHLPTNFSG